MLDDLKFAFRQLVKNPGFSLIATFALALGIGANKHRRVRQSAPGARIFRLVLGHGMSLMAIGIFGGLAGAIAVGCALVSLLYNVGTLDPGPVATAVFSLLAVAIIACCVPARRATRVDPIVALRTE